MQNHYADVKGGPKAVFAKAIASTTGMDEKDVFITAIYIGNTKVARRLDARRLADSVVRVEFTIVTTSDKVIDAAAIPAATLKTQVTAKAKAAGATIVITAAPVVDTPTQSSVDTVPTTTTVVAPTAGSSTLLFPVLAAIMAAVTHLC